MVRLRKTLLRVCCLTAAGTTTLAAEPLGQLPDCTARAVLVAGAPQYPETARRARIKGTVLVDVGVGPSGEVQRTSVVKTWPLGLSDAADLAAHQWRFSAADGSCKIRLSFEFDLVKLKDGGTAPTLITLPSSVRVLAKEPEALTISQERHGLGASQTAAQPRRRQ
jgi:TonB family protein